MLYDQGRNEVRWCPGQEASLAPPYSHLRSFGSKCTVLKKVLVALFGLFGNQHVCYANVLAYTREDSSREVPTFYR